MKSSNQSSTQDNSSRNLAVIRRAGNIRSFIIIKTIMGSGVVDALPLRVRCECSKPGCEEIIELDLARRRELRRSFRQGFLVAPSHTDPTSDSILSQDATCNVVGKVDFPESVSDL